MRVCCPTTIWGRCRTRVSHTFRNWRTRRGRYTIRTTRLSFRRTSCTPSNASTAASIFSGSMYVTPHLFFLLSTPNLPSIADTCDVIAPLPRNTSSSAFHNTLLIQRRSSTYPSELYVRSCSISHGARQRRYVSCLRSPRPSYLRHKVCDTPHRFLPVPLSSFSSPYYSQLLTAYIP